MRSPCQLVDRRVTGNAGEDTRVMNACKGGKSAVRDLDQLSMMVFWWPATALT